MTRLMFSIVADRRSAWAQSRLWCGRAWDQAEVSSGSGAPAGVTCMTAQVVSQPGVASPMARIALRRVACALTMAAAGSAASTIISTSTLHEVRSAVRSGSSIALSAASRLSSASIKASSRAPKAGAPGQVTSWTVRYFTGDLLPEGLKSFFALVTALAHLPPSLGGGYWRRLGVDTVT